MPDPADAKTGLDTRADVGGSGGTGSGGSGGMPGTGGTGGAVIKEDAAPDPGEKRDASPVVDSPPGLDAALKFDAEVKLDAAPKLDAPVGGSALLVVANAAALSPGDRVLQGRLTALGFAVAVESDEAVTAADANGKALILVAESVASMDVAAKFRDIAVPLVSCESFIYDDLKMTGTVADKDFDYAIDQTDVTITASGHPMAAGLTGTIAVSAKARFMWGLPATSATRVATVVGQPMQVTIFGYEAGADMVGMKAPARRVGFFPEETSASTLTANGAKLLDAALIWAASR